MSLKSLERKIEKVELIDVNFAYANGPVELREANLQLTRGGITAVVGESGAGKSTICDLCLRFRTADSGLILYNDQDIRNITEESLRQCVALVEQEPFLFERTVKYNLLIGNPHATADEIWQALKTAEAADFVRGMEGGLDTNVGHGGRNVSVGQRQRLALARAILKRPQLLILDELTGSLDLHNESQILQTVEKLADQMIILCTTHRNSVMKRASAVYRLEDGHLSQVS